MACMMKTWLVLGCISYVFGISRAKISLIRRVVIEKIIHLLCKRTYESEKRDFVRVYHFGETAGSWTADSDRGPVQ